MKLHPADYQPCASCGTTTFVCAVCGHRFHVKGLGAPLMRPGEVFEDCGYSACGPCADWIKQQMQLRADSN